MVILWALGIPRIWGLNRFAYQVWITATSLVTATLLGDPLRAADHPFNTN